MMVAPWMRVGFSACLCLWAVIHTATSANWAEKYGENINFTLYLNDKNVTYNINDSALILSDPGFKKAQTTVLYLPGYTESNQSLSVGTVSSAFLARGDHNFILVDWNHYTAFPYLRAFFNMFQVSHALAKAITRMVEAGLQKESLWIVAHSLGGQLAGVTAKDLDFKVSRITALDPALPGFSFEDIPNLGPEDAELVDVIHTDSGNFGFGPQIAHLDFLPNSGSRVQPGCPKYSISESYCSHHRSWYYFAESLLNETAFPALRCSSWDEFTKDSCQKNDVVYMGIKAREADKSKYGVYYLETADKAPFGKGLEGITNLSSRRGGLLSKLFGYLTSGNGESLATNWGWDSRKLA